MEKEKPKSKKFDIEKIKCQLRKVAKHNCKRCHGTGYIGIHVIGKRIVLCRCAMKKIQPEWNKKIKERIEEDARKSRDKEKVLKKS